MNSKAADESHALFATVGAVVVIGMIVLASYSSPILLPAPQSSSSANEPAYTASSGPAVSNSLNTSSQSIIGTTVEANSTTQAKSIPVSTGVIVPIFSSYSAVQQNDVNEVVQAKSAYPKVPIIAVLNPAGGPGGSYDSNYLSEVKSMQAVNVTVLGYVPTWWGTRNITSVESDIHTFYVWYGVNGIYLDQMPNWEKDGPQGQWYYTGTGGTYIPAYFSNITGYVKSLGMTIDFGNSGADIPHNLLGTVSIVGIFENGFAPAYFGWPSLTGIGAWHLTENKTNFAFFCYNVPSLNSYYITGAADYVSYLYVTNGELNQPYVTLPPYFEGLVSTLASMVQIRIVSESMNGTVFGGMQVTLTQEGGVSSMGYTPFTFNAIAGSNATISAASFSGQTFSHWSDGNTAPIRNITITQSMNLVAYYTQ